MKNAVPVLLLLVFTSGCATVPYQYGRSIESTNGLKLRPGESQIERGRPQAFIDGEIGQWTPVPYVVYFAAVIPGHIAGRVKASKVDKRRDNEREAAREPGDE